MAAKRGAAAVVRGKLLLQMGWPVCTEPSEYLNVGHSMRPLSLCQVVEDDGQDCQTIGKTNRFANPVYYYGCVAIRDSREQL